MTFRTFDDGIRIARGFAADPATGKVGELYWNTARLLIRQCVNATGPVWEDVTVKPGTTGFGTLYWDAVQGRWRENVLLLIDGRKVYAANSAAAAPLLIQSGDTTNPGIAGSNVVLQPGTGALGQGDVEVHALNMRQSVDLGTALNIFAGADTVNPAGNDLNLSAGQGTATLGDANVIGEDVNLNAGDKIRLNGEVVFSQILVADPLTPETAQLYWHDGFKRFRKFDGVNWHWIDANRYNSPIVIVDLFDDAILTLPTDTSTLVDGQTVTDGMLVIMQNSGSPVVYLATVAGINITWTAQTPGQSPTVNPSIGDSVYVRNGVDNVDSFYFFQAAGTWVDPFSSSNAPVLAGININDTIRWDGIAWVADTTVRQNGSGTIYAPENTDNDPAKSNPITLQGGQKTDGTGDGGDVVLQGGASVGGIQGDVEVDANALILPQPFSPSPRNAGLVFDPSRNKPKVAFGGTFRDLDGADINGELTGFVNTTGNTISFDNGTLTFTIAQVGLIPFEFYIKGEQFIKDTVLLPETVVITNTVGNHYIYFDALGVLTSNTIYDLQSGLKNTCLIAIINWNGTAATLLADRRTLLTMDGDARFNKRNINPIEVLAGDFTVTSGTGGTGFDSSVAINGGNLYIEEAVRAVTSRTSAANQIPIMYLSGTNVMNEANITASMRNNGANLLYNLFTGGVWTQAVVPEGGTGPNFSTGFFNIWIAVTTDPTRPVVIFQPQTVYQSVAEATKELASSVVSFWPKSEYKIIHRLTMANTLGTQYGTRKQFDYQAMARIQSDVNELIRNANQNIDYWVNIAATADFNWDLATGILNFGNFNMQLIGRQGSANSISAGSITLNAGQVAYVEVNRDIDNGAPLGILIGTANSVETSNLANQNRIILFKRIQDEIYIGNGLDLKVQKRSILADNTVALTPIFTFPAGNSANRCWQIEYSVYRNGVLETGRIDVVRGSLADIGQSITGASNGATGVTLTVVDNAGTLQLQYTSTNTGSSAVMRYSIKQWLAS